MVVFESYLFFDLETTGHIRHELQYNDTEKYPHITEIALLLVGKSELLTATEEMSEKAENENLDLRVKVPGIRKIFNCYPNMTEEKWITYREDEFPTFKRLSREFLREKPSFGLVWAEIVAFIAAAPKPACMVAHNGNLFDFKIIYQELLRLGKEEERGWMHQLHGLDSLKLLRSLDKEAVARFKDALRTADGQVADSLSILLKRLECEEAVIEEIRTKINDICATINEPPSTHRRISMKEVQAAVDSTIGAAVLKGRKRRIQRTNQQDNKEQAQRKSFGQGKLYSEIFGSTFDAHKADEDCEALLQICLSYGVHFVRYVEDNAKELGECLKAPSTLPRKLRDFLSRPIGKKGTKVLPGISDMYAFRLKASQLLEKFVELEKNEERMENWLWENARMLEEHSENTIDALLQYSSKYP